MTGLFRSFINHDRSGLFVLTLEIELETSALMERKPRSRRQTATVSYSRWFAYAAAGAATAAGTAPFVEAEIHYSGLVHAKFNGTFFSSQLFPLTGGAKLNFERFTSFGSIFWDYVAVRDAAVSAGIRTAYPRSAEKLSFGQIVSTGRFYNGSVNNKLVMGYPSTAYGQFKDPGQGFVGFKCDVGNGTQYGWARVLMGEAQKHNFVLKDYAFADPGEPIRAGQTSSAGDMVDKVPDSGSVGLLALGAAGLVAWRKRRAQVTQ